jgi:tRNA (guanine37-N1)-methyltransferase
MLKFDIITIFPGIFNSYLKESFIKKAQEKGKIKINIHDLRKYTRDRHKTVDDRPYGGGLGMVLKIEPIFKAISTLTKLKIKRLSPRLMGLGLKKSKVILFTPRGKKFNQKMAFQFSKLDRIIMICGRYEGVDERVAKHIADLELSIGDYDLMGGELPAMVVMETVARLIPGVLGKPELLKERITKEKEFIEYPQYTRPPKFFVKKFGRARPEVWQVPKVLISGHHKKIEEWRGKYGKHIGK